jgi:hypothetical protein
MARPGFCNTDGCNELASADYREPCKLCLSVMCPAHYGKVHLHHTCPIYVSC